MAAPVDRLEAGAAEPVDRLPRDRDRQPGQQQRHARDIAVVLTSLIRAAQNHILDDIWRNARALDRLGDHQRGEIIRTHLFERARILANGRTHRRKDHDLILLRHDTTLPLTNVPTGPVCLGMV